LTANASDTNGSNERLAIVAVAFQKGFGWHLGKGIGSWQWSKSGLLGFRHFGLNSIYAFVTLGGIWFYICYTFAYAWILTKICKRRINSKFYYIITIICIVIVSIFTVIFTSTTSTIWLSMIFATFAMIQDKIANNHQGTAQV
jgi:cation transport ATPase